METAILKKEVEPMLVALGKYIRQKRVALGMSQEDLADKAGLHRTYVSDVERGIRNLTIGACWLIAHGLGIQLNQMITAVDHPAQAQESVAPTNEAVDAMSFSPLPTDVPAL